MINSALIAIGVAGLTIGIIAYLYGNKEKRMSRASVQSKSDEKEPAATDESPAPTKTSIKDKVKGWWNRPLGPVVGLGLGLGVAIFFGIWMWDEVGHDLTHANEGSGMMTYNGTQIKVSKLGEDMDLAELTRYSTPGEGEELTFFAPKGVPAKDIELYVVVLEKNDHGDVTPAVGHEPVLYEGQALNKCKVGEYGLYLGPNSKVSKVTIVANVDATKTCSHLSDNTVRN